MMRVRPFLCVIMLIFTFSFLSSLLICSSLSLSLSPSLRIPRAIEGAIGSVYKIDASYLSPNVNIASRLCGATKQYGVRLLISGPLHSLMQPEIQRRCRHLDVITVKGSKLPLDIWTFDVGHLALKTDEMIAAMKAAEEEEAKRKKLQAAAAAIASPSAANASTGSHVLAMPKPNRAPLAMPKPRLISLQSVATVHDDDDDAAAQPDIPLDEDNNPIDPSLLPKRPSELFNDVVQRFKQRGVVRRISGTGGMLISSLASVFQSNGGSKPTSNKNSKNPSPAATPPPLHQQHSGVNLLAPNQTNGHASNRIYPEQHLLSSDLASKESQHHIHIPSKSSSPVLPHTLPSAFTPFSSSPAPSSSSPLPTSPMSPSDASSASSPKVVKPKVESGNFTPSTLAGLCAQLQRGLSEDFVRSFNEASRAYIRGHWTKAKELLDKFLIAYPDDKPAKVLLEVMGEYNFHKPSDWKGFRKLTSK